MFNRSMQSLDTMKNTVDKISPAPGRRRKTILFLVWLASMTALLAVLTVLVSLSDTSSVDLAITRFIQSVSSPALTVVMKLVSWFGYTPQSYLMAALALCALLWLGLRAEALALASVSVLEELLNMAIKALVHRPRPLSSLVHVVVALKSYSFPSGHVMFYTCFFGFLFYLAHMLLKPSWRRAALLVVFGFPVLTIGLSRVYLGEHWASDVLGAYLAGFIVLLCGIQLYRWRKNRSPAKP